MLGRAGTRWVGGLAAAAVAALAATAAAGAEERLAIVATVGMIGDVAAEVGGDCVEVTTLMGPGIDPHLYQATAADVRALQEAEAILFAGYALEGQLGAVLARLGRDRPTLAVSEAAAPPAELIAVDDLDGVDPHLWMDPGLWARTAAPIAELIGALRPDCAGAAAERAASYAAELAALADWVAASIASIPEGRRYLVTAHDAFGYFARAFGIEEVAIQGLSTQSEASIADIRDTAARVAELGVPAVFVETTINPRTIQAVIEATAERGHAVTIGGDLYSDAMGEAGTADGTYVGMIHANTRVITEALGGTVPPLPAALAAWAEDWGLDAG